MQCTPDLMPADILGTHIVAEDAGGQRVLRFEKGPVFRNLLLVDEINRTTPKTQAAALGSDARAQRHHGRRTFCASPIHSLCWPRRTRWKWKEPIRSPKLSWIGSSSSCASRFRIWPSSLKSRAARAGLTSLTCRWCSTSAEVTRFQHVLSHVPVADPLTRYAASLILATHPESAEASPRVRRFIAYGASPRGLQSLIRASPCALRRRRSNGRIDRRYPPRGPRRCAID